MTAVRYPYTERNLLEQPERYSYAPYAGPAFLNAHARARQRLRDALGQHVAPGVPRPNATPSERPGQRGFITRDVLLWLIADRRDGRPTVDLEESWAQALSRRFEITKRLHCCYSASLRPASDRFDTIENYAALAELLLDDDRAFSDLRRLNAGLKLLDLLGSVPPPPERYARGMIARALDGEGRALARLRQAVTVAA